MENIIKNKIIDNNEPGWDLYGKLVSNIKKGQTVILSSLRLPLTTEYINSIRNSDSLKG